jgi:hypothetical protein
MKNSAEAEEKIFTESHHGDLPTTRASAESEKAQAQEVRELFGFVRMLTL